MLGKIVLTAGLLTFGALAGPQISSASPLAPAKEALSTEAGLVQQVHRRCREVCRRVCNRAWNPWDGSHCHWRTRCHTRCGGGYWY